MRILVFLIIGLLAAGNAAADRDRGDYSRKWQSHHGELKSHWNKRSHRYSPRLRYLKTTGLNSGVCDELKGATRGLRMMCMAFCELQSCSPDFTAENPFESCSRSSKWIYARYEKRRGPGDPDMPCVKQPAEVAECPCWARDELANLRQQSADDRFAVCELDSNPAPTMTNFDSWRIESQTSGDYYTLVATFGSYGADAAPTCAVTDTCADGACLGETRMLSITPEQLAACEADVAMSAANRGLTCN